jgi:hypothetical protein
MSITISLLMNNILVSDTDKEHLLLRLQSKRHWWSQRVIVPGAHDDVIIGTPAGISRVYVNPR